MVVYVDDMYRYPMGQYGRMKMSHMVADSTKELMKMADKIGLSRRHIQAAGTWKEHFDVSLGYRQQAVALGAVEVTMRQLSIMRRSKMMADKSVKGSLTLIAAVATLTQEDLVPIWKSGRVRRYKKFGTVRAVMADPGKQYVTSIDGKTETKNTAKPNDVAIIGVKGEVYLLNKSKFEKRYRPRNRPVGDVVGTFYAIGETYGMKYKGPTFNFVASWGEKMVCNKGDMLCCLVGTGDNGDIYRIEKSAFKATYREA